MYQQTKKRLTSRDLQALETKEKIYRASLRILEKSGFQNLKIADICKEAQVSIGSFYHYYTSKEDVIFSHYAKFDEYFEKTATTINGENVAERVLNFFQLYSEYHLSLSLELNKQWYSPVAKLAIPKERFTYELLGKLISQGREAGEIVSSMDDEEIVQELMMFARGVILDWLYKDASYDLVKKMHDTMKRILNLYLVSGNFSL